MPRAPRPWLPLVLLGAVLAACAGPSVDRSAPDDPLQLTPARFADLPGWQADAHADALPALRRSCDRLATLPATRPMGGAEDAAGRDLAGTVGDWQPACEALAAIAPGDHAAAKAYFEVMFTPFEATGGGAATGLFTGYFEPLLQGSRTRDARFRWPLHARPPELVEVDLGAFREDMRGSRIAGRVAGGRLVPFADRAAIDGGALADRDLEIVWVDDPIALFFLHIQGSGIVRLPDGEAVRVGFAGQNGHPYFAIGRELIARGELDRQTVSLQSIRAWLEANPDQATEVLHLNRSYIFFRTLSGAGPIGAQGVALTPGRSLAVDRRHLALTTPVWLDATYPDPDTPTDPAADRPIQRLMIAQDTGGAILGPVRGDVFWGAGPDARAIAGHMKHDGRTWLLLPNTVAGVPVARR